MISKILTFSLVLLIWAITGMLASAQTLDKLYPFPEFKDAFTQKLSDLGAMPNQQAYHFVVLMNTTDTEGPISQWMRSVYYGLVSEYLKDGDRISFVPYQLKVREDYALWDRVYNSNDVSYLYSKLPPRPAIQDGYDSGHDDEAALLTAIEHISPESAVYIMLSDKGASSRPRDVPSYPLTDITVFQNVLSKAGISKIAEFRYDQLVEDNGQKIPCTLFCRVYAKTSLKPLATLNHSRDAKNQEIKVHTPKPETDSGGSQLTDLWWIVLLIVVVGGIGGYYVWLLKPRNIQLGPITGSVVYGKRLYLGGEDAGSNVLVYPGVPSTQRIAVLEVGMDGNVTMRNEGFCRVSKGSQRDRITIRAISETVIITDNQTEEILYEIEARTTQ